MKPSFNIFYRGMFISFLGSLPPGIMNILGSEIYHDKGAGDALLYVTGFMLAETLLVRVTLFAMDRILRSRNFFHVLEWVTAIMLIVFSIVCFIATDSMQQNRARVPGLLLPSFLMGVVISLINPMHIPFWLGSSTVLMNKGLLRRDARQYNLYIVGIAIGTVAGFVVFISGGSVVLRSLQSSQYLINCIVGIVLFVTAFLHIRKMLFVPIAVRHSKLLKHE